MNILGSALIAKYNDKRQGRGEQGKIIPSSSFFDKSLSSLFLIPRFMMYNGCILRLSVAN